MTTTQTLSALLLAASVAAWPAHSAAQQAPPAQPPLEKPAAKPAQPPSDPAQPAAGGYSYKPDGRRDPFVNLLGMAADPRAATNRPTGIAGFLINEVVVTGIIKGGASFTAMLRGPDNRTYIVRTGERLLDGSVKSISERQVVFSQDVNDPLSLVKQREIPKSVRPGGESME
jgi:Tfp pilus assembly protein PilP